MKDLLASSKDEKNRAIAEWLGWTKVRPDGNDVSMGVAPNRRLLDYIPDFFSSEEASALVLEKMAGDLIRREYPLDPPEVRWRIRNPHLPDGVGPWSVDRKTAIAEAALALIESEKKK